MMHPKNKVEPVSDSVSGKTQLVPSGHPEITADAASRTTTPLAFSDVAERVHSDRRLERNTLVWKDTNGNIFTTLSSESNIEVECSDVLDGFNFDRPELILRILGNAEHNTTSYDYREIPELEYCVSYTGKGGIHLLPVPLRRRLIQLVHEIGAWIVSEYEGKDILESTNQPYVMPDQLKPKFSPESSIWPPTLGYSSVYLANAPRSQEQKPKPQSSNDPFECVLLANGNVQSLERMLSTLDLSKANILALKGSGGLADALANSESGETSNFTLDTVLSSLGVRWSPHKTDSDCYVIEDDVEMSEDDFEMSEDDSKATGSKATIYQQKIPTYDERQTILNTSIPENLYDGKNHLTVSKGMGTPRATLPQDFVGPSHGQNSARSELVISVKNFEKLCAKVTIFEADLTLPDYGLGKAILQCILKGQPERNIKLLRLCLDLDCFGEAETYIFPKGYQSLDPSPVVQTAFMKKRLKFLEYFLRTGVFDALQDDEYVINSIITDSRALSFIDETLWHKKKVNHKDFFGINDHLFRQCLMSKNFDMIDISQLFWFKTKDPLGTLLLANIYLTKVAEKEKNHLKRAQIKATAIEYQGLAVSFVNACFDKDPETTIKMITHKMDQFDEKSCIDLAMESSNLDFLVQPACITVQRRVWRWGNLYDFYKENEDVANTLFPPSTDNKREKIESKTLWRRYYMLLCAPKTMFTLNGLALLIFIYMFGLTLLGRLEQYNFHWLEAVLLSNVMVGLCEEIYEMTIFAKTNWRNYFKSGWNIADLTSITLFLVAAGCRVVSYFFTGNFLFELSRVGLAIDFMIFTLRLLHNCYSSPDLGPTCAMMIKTIKLLTRYLYLLLLVWASYAIASESVLYPNSVLSIYTFYYLFRKAYWQMFGELFLDELEAGNASNPNALECTNDVSLYATYQMLRCPSTFGRYVAPVLLAVYIMFTYVLLFSLITASFTKSIEKIQQKAYKLWRFQFFELTRSFSKIMFLPLPFTLISVAAVLCDEEGRDEDGFSISDGRNKKFLQEIKETKRKLYERLPTNGLNGSGQDGPSDMACCLAGISKKFKVIRKCVKKPHKENSSEARDSAFSDLKEIMYNYGTYLKKTQLKRELEETVKRIEKPDGPFDATHILNLKTFITEYGSSVSEHLHRANTHERAELKLKHTLTEIKALEREFPEVQPIVSTLRVKISCIERLHFVNEMKKCIFELEKRNTIDNKGNQIQKQLMKLRNPNGGKESKIQILFNELLDLTEKLEESNLGASGNDSVKQERTTIREIRRRIHELQNALYKRSKSSQSRLEVKDMLGSSIREKIRGLLTALNYYWQISCDSKMMQPLDDLEKLMLQNQYDDEYCQMRAKIKDLESFILQSHIEPMLQIKRNSSKPDRKSIEKIQQKAYKLWRFQFFELTRSFSKIMFLPLPFTLISVAAVLCDEEGRDEDGFSISDGRNKKFLQEIKETKRKLYERLPTNGLNGSGQDGPSDMACCLAGISKKFKVIRKCVKKPHKENSSEARDSAFSDLKEIMYNYGTYLKKTQLKRELEETVKRIEKPDGPFDATHILNLKTFITEYGSSVSEHLHRANTHERAELKLKHTLTEIKALEREFPEVQPIVSTLRVKISCIERLHFVNEMKKCIFELEKRNTIDNKGNQIQKQLMKLRNPNGGKESKIQILFNELLDLTEKLEESNLGASGNDSVKQERTTIREIRRRIHELQNALYKRSKSSQSRLEVKDMLGSSIREKIRGLLTALNYYWQISCDSKMMQPLDDLEKLMLQNQYDDEYCQMRAKIKDLESFILQSHIEPMLQIKRNSSKPDSEKEKNKEAPTNRSPSAAYANKAAPRAPGNTESAREQNSPEDDVEDAHQTHWVPIQSDQDYVTRSKDAKPSKDEPEDPKTLKFNRYDSKYRVERRSYLGRYEVNEHNFPINPYSDSETPEDQLSVELPRWGPNHFGIPVISRVKFESKEKKVAKRDNKPVLEFLVETTDDGKYHFPKVNISASRDLFITYIKIKERETADLKKNAGSNPTPRGTRDSSGSGINASGAARPRNPPKPENSTIRSKQRWRIPLVIKKAFPKPPENDRKKKQTQMHMKPNQQIQMRSCQKTKTIFIGLAESETMMTKHKWAEFRIINYHNPNTHYQHVIDALINEPLSNLRWIDYSKYSLVENFTGKDIFAFVCGHRGCYFEKRPGTTGRSARPRTAKVGIPQGKSEPGTSAKRISEPVTSAQGISEPGTSAQGISEPGTSAQDRFEPVTSVQGISEPVTSAQGISEPATSAHGISEPGLSAQ